MEKSAEIEFLPVKAFGWAARDSSGILSPFNFSRRATGDHDVQFKVLYCGICHSDLSMVRNEWNITQYPVVPGHEIVGVVTEVGPKVEKFKAGDKVGVGFLIGSCGKCDQCVAGLENYCPEYVATYVGSYTDGKVSCGGYSDVMVAPERFVVLWPENLPPGRGAPLLGAGITAYSPLRHFGLDKPGVSVGVVGLGGIGHLAVKFAKAFGAKVTVISSSLSKKKEAVESLGVDEFLISTDKEQLQAAASTLDGIIDTVCAKHPIAPLLSLLKPQGKLVLIGEMNHDLPAFQLITGRKIVAGSAVGGLRETQEMVDFAAKHNVVPDVEIIPMEYANAAMDRLAKADVKYRFVIDIANSLANKLQQGE